MTLITRGETIHQVLFDSMHLGQFDLPYCLPKFLFDVAMYRHSAVFNLDCVFDTFFSNFYAEKKCP